jgi:cardiolipin synthase
VSQPPASQPDDPGNPALAARPAPPVASNRILTVPNLLSFIRLLGVPLFLYLLLGPQLDGWALVVLIVSAITDYADGKLARLLDQYSRLGELLDPAADRLYILAALVGFVLRGFIPWWVAVLIIGRDVLLACTLPILRRYGYTALPVHYLGKAATFCLLYGLPMLLLAQGDSLISQIALPTSYAFIAWGLVMYLVAGGIYFQQLGWVIRNCPLAPRFRPPTALPTDPSGVTGG